ncbi:hypothetical protein B566_EDAN010769 [Ephemera danica]|nr:hypothetical protein B566_EDAN010769 [Ephemera danica]
MEATYIKMAKQALFESYVHNDSLPLCLRSGNCKSCINASDNNPPLYEMVQSRVNSGDIFFSVEISPPKTVTGTVHSLSNLHEMKHGGALYCSVTWHPGNDPGGTSLTSSMTIAGFAAKHSGCETMLHMAGSHISHQQMDEYLHDDSECEKSDFPYAVDFVQHIEQKFGKQFTIAVAGYPCGHPEAQSYLQDLQYLKSKVEAGANLILTQMFFEAETFIKFVHDCRSLGISVPIIPGIMPIQSYASLMHMVRLTRVQLPTNFSRDLEQIKHHDEAVESYGIHKSVELCQKIFEAGVAPGIHIFTLNRSSAPIELCKRLGMWLHGPMLPLACCIKDVNDQDKGLSYKN